MKLYHYPKCSTCKKALAFLRERKVAFEAIDISVSPPSKTELHEMIKRQGSIKPLFNTSGQSYRAGKFSERIPTMSKEDAVEALSKDGMLIKRPFLLSADHALVGFKPDAWSKVR